MFKGILTAGLVTLSLAEICLPAENLPDAEELSRKIESYFGERSMAEGPGVAILVARGEEVLLRRAWGMAQIELGVPLSPDHVFRIGSNSKQFTAAAVLKLAEAGKFSLTDPLSKFLPDYPNGRNITVQQLLNHTAGIVDYTELPDFLKNARADVDLPTLISRFKDQRPNFAPGTGWLYCNSGYVLLSAVIERATGQPWAQVIQSAVITPAGLTHTRVGDDLPIISERVAGYTRGEHGEVTNVPYISMTQPMAAGSLVSSLDDLFHWTRALHTGHVLPPARYQEMITPLPNGSGKPTDYGYGLFVSPLRGEKMLWHGGQIPGFTTVVGYAPKGEVTVVVLCNSDAPQIDPEILMRKTAALGIGRPYPAWHSIKLTAAQLEELKGVYRVDEKTTRILSVRGDQLYSQRGEAEPKPLLASSADELYLQDTLDYFAVVRNAAGEVTALDQFADGEPPAKRQQKVSMAPPVVPPSGGLNQAHENL